MFRNAGMHANNILARRLPHRSRFAIDSGRGCRRRQDKAAPRHGRAPSCHDRRVLRTPCFPFAPLRHHCGATLPVAASTTIVPVMCGCKEQKYLLVPGVVNVNENLSSLSTAFDLRLLRETTV